MWGSLPQEASDFLIRAIVLFLVWKLIYAFWLSPMGEPDGWLVRRLGDATVATLNLLNRDEVFMVSHTLTPKVGDPAGLEDVAVVYRQGRRPDVAIHAPCNGLELMVLGVGFILCFEGSWSRRLAYVVAMLTGVFAVNVLRCCLLTVIKTDHPAYFEFAHKYIFNLAGYGFVFLLWMHYVKTGIRSGSSPTEV